MKKAKRRLEISLIGLFTFPYTFIIICGLLSIKYTFMYRYIDLVFVVFAVLLVFFLVNTVLAYRKYEKLRSDEKEIIEETQKEQTIVFQDDESDEVEPIVNLVGKGSVFCGNIESDDDVLVQGTLIGDIYTKQDVFVDGVVKGNIHCRFIALKEAMITGEIISKEQITMDEKTVITGSASAKEVIVPGRIEGDIHAEEHVQLFRSSVVYGDINCNNVDFARGATIRGKVSIS